MHCTTMAHSTVRTVMHLVLHGKSKSDPVGRKCSIVWLASGVHVPSPRGLHMHTRPQETKKKENNSSNRNVLFSAKEGSQEVSGDLNWRYGTYRSHYPHPLRSDCSMLQSLYLDSTITNAQ